MNSSQQKKRKFRMSSKWKRFRLYMKNKNRVDEITKKPLLKNWNLHHLDLNEEHYTKIENEKNFACLNKMTHEIVHNLFRYYCKDKTVIKRLKQMLDKMVKLNET